MPTEEDEDKHIHSSEDSDYSDDEMNEKKKHWLCSCCRIIPK